MVFTQRAKLLYAVAGSGVVLGIYNYFQTETHVQNSWTTNFTPSVKWDDNWDRRDMSSMIKPAKRDDPVDEKRYHEEKKKLKPTATRYLFLVRHGQYDMAPSTDTERCLTNLGRLQAEFTGQRLADLNFNYSKMIHSTMTRAIETANIIHKFLPNVPMESCELLREGVPTPPEPPIGSWKAEPQFFQEGARIEAAFRKHFHRADSSQTSDSFEIIVCHANVIRYFICRLLQFPPEAWLRFSLYHCSITSVAIRPNGRVVVYTVGDSGHLPPSKLTTKMSEFKKNGLSPNAKGNKGLKGKL